jgi:hypothetical protein
MQFSHEITLGMILNWVVMLGVGVTIFGLLKYTFKRERELLIPREEHERHCQTVVKELLESRHIAIKEAVDIHTKILDEKFKAQDALMKLSIIEAVKIGNSKG